MPTVSLNREVLNKILGQSYEDKFIFERMLMLGTPIERSDENEIVVEVSPNRPDMLSTQGYGRALSSFLGIKTGFINYAIKKSGNKVIVDKSVAMRPYTACAIIKNIKFTDDRIREIMQMQEKLAMTHGRKRNKSAYGVYPIDNVVFPINYIAKDPTKVMFQPLGFEKKMVAIETEKVHPTSKEYKYIADSWKKQGYDKYPFFIDSKDNVMCMLPYTNSHDTGKVELTTKQVFIECTGTDYLNIKYALNIFVTMFADMGADIYSIDVVYPDKIITTPDFSTLELAIDYSYINKRLGLELSKAEINGLLEKMGYSVKKNKVMIPPYRADIMHQADFSEDVAIAYGYENFKEEIPKISTVGQESPESIFNNRIADCLVGLGYLEASTLHLINKEKQTLVMNYEADVVEILKSVSKEHDSLRKWLLPVMMEVLGTNKHNEYPQRLFTIGKVFSIDTKEETNVREETKLCIIIANKDANYTDARQALDYLMRMLDKEYKITEGSHRSLIPGRAGDIFIGGKKIGFLGEVAPVVLTNFGMEVPVTCVEINLGPITESFSKPTEIYTEQSGFLIHNNIIKKYQWLIIDSINIANISVAADSKNLFAKQKQALIDKWKDNDSFEKEPELIKYKEFHEKLGLTDVTSAAEAIIKRYLSKGEFPNINSAVDAGNIVSCEELTSIGMFDLGKIKGKVKVRFAQSKDSYLPYGHTELQKIKEGRIILEDEEKIFAVVGYKDSIRTSVDERTKNILVVSWGSKDKDETKIRAVFEKLSRLLSIEKV
ncbi:MAG: phenylalanine--tRNA ligase subunit beta [archaeon]